MLSELGRAVPQIKAPLIDERDQMTARRPSTLGGNSRRIIVDLGECDCFEK